MNGIASIFTKEKTDKIQTITSLEVAEMVEKQHKELLRDIRAYIEYLGQANEEMEELGERKIALTDFFIESTYLSGQNKILPCYDITRKGCEYIATKLTGVKGAVFTAKFINRFHEMEDCIKVEQKPSLDAVNRAADILKGVYQAAGTDERYLALLVGSVYKECGMKFALPPVKMDADKLYDQTMIANELGIMSTSGKPHAQAVGAIIDILDISDDDKITTPYTNHGHSGVVVQYKGNVVNMVLGWLEDNGYPRTIIGENKKYNVSYK